MVEFFWWSSSYCSCYCQTSVLYRFKFLMKGGVTSLVISKVWLQTNVLYIVSKDDLGRIGWNLCNRPIVLLFLTGTSLNKRQEWSSFLVFLLNITSWACLVKSRLKIIFHWKAQLLITDRSLCKVAALDWMSLTTEKRDIIGKKFAIWRHTIW